MIRSPSTGAHRKAIAAGLTLLLCVALPGCAVVTVAGAAVGVLATGASLAVDAAVGTAKVVGAGISTVLPGEPAK